MKRMTSLLLLFLYSSLTFSKVSVDSVVVSDSFYVNSPVSVKIKVNYKEIKDISLNIYNIPVKNAKAAQLESRTTFDDGSISQEIIFFFDRAGVNTIPSIPVYVRGTLGNKPYSELFHTKPLTLKIPRMEDKYDFTGQDLDVSIEVLTDLKDRKLKKGDSIKYRLSLNVQNSSVLFIPELKFKQIEDVFFYSKKVLSKDSANRGVVFSEVVYEIIVIYNRAGKVILKLEDMKYLNLEDGSVNTVEVEPIETSISGIYLSRDQKKILAFGCIVILFFFVLFFIFRIQIAHFLANKKEFYRLRKELINALESNNHSKVVRILYSVFDDRFGDLFQYELCKYMKLSDTPRREVVASFLSEYFSFDNRGKYSKIELEKVFTNFYSKIKNEEDLNTTNDLSLN